MPGDSKTHLYTGEMFEMCKQGCWWARCGCGLNITCSWIARVDELIPRGTSKADNWSKDCILDSTLHLH